MANVPAQQGQQDPQVQQNGQVQPNGQGQQNQQPPSDQDKYDFYTVLAAIVGLVVVLGIVIAAFSSKTTTLINVLGIVVPVLGAAVGYTGGNARGKAVGKQTGKTEAAQQIRNALLPRVRPVREQAAELMNPVRSQGIPAPGQPSRMNVYLAPGPNEPATGQPAQVASDLDQQLGGIEQYLEALH